MTGESGAGTGTLDPAAVAEHHAARAESERKAQEVIAAAPPAASPDAPAKPRVGIAKVRPIEVPPETIAKVLRSKIVARGFARLDWRPLDELEAADGGEALAPLVGFLVGYVAQYLPAVAEAVSPFGQACAQAINWGAGVAAPRALPQLLDAGVSVVVVGPAPEVPHAPQA